MPFMWRNSFLTSDFTRGQTQSCSYFNVSCPFLGQNTSQRMWEITRMLSSFSWCKDTLLRNVKRSRCQKRSLHNFSVCLRKKNLKALWIWCKVSPFGLKICCSCVYGKCGNSEKYSKRLPPRQLAAAAQDDEHQFSKNKNEFKTSTLGFHVSLKYKRKTIENMVETQPMLLCSETAKALMIYWW